MLSLLNFLLVIPLLICPNRLIINYKYRELSKSFFRLKIVKISCDYRSCRIVLSFEILDLIRTLLMRSMINSVSMAKSKRGQASYSEE